MHRHKLRLRLEVEVPISFRDTKTGKTDPKWSLTLVDFLLTPYRVEWTIRTGSGELIEGRLNIPRPLPAWEDSSILLSYPVSASCKPKGTFRPEFIVTLPSAIVPEHLAR